LLFSHIVLTSVVATMLSRGKSRLSIRAAAIAMFVAMAKPSYAALGCSHAEIVADLTTPTSYDKYRDPNPNGPTLVKVQFYLSSLQHVDEKRQLMTITGYMRTMWYDPRLAFNKSHASCSTDELAVRGEDVGKFWTPTIYVENSASHSVGAESFVVQSSGQVARSQRMKQALECPMDFKPLPFDKQHCTMEVGPYSEKSDVVVMGLQGDGWVIDKESYNNPEWRVQGWSGEVIRSTYLTGSFDLAHLTITIARRWPFFLLSHVFSAVLFVLISYTGFYISRKVAPARVAISVIPVLIMRVLDNSVKAGMPKIGDLTWLTSFLLMCMIFCVSAVFEYGIVCHLMNNEKWAAKRFDGLKEISGQLSKGDPKGTGDMQDAPGTGTRRTSDIEMHRAESDDESDSENEPTHPLMANRDTVLSKVLDLSGLTPSQIIAVDLAFCKMDPGDTGEISQAGMQQGLKYYDKYYTKRQVAEIFEKVGLRRDEDMTPQHFVAFLQQLPTPTHDPTHDSNTRFAGRRMSHKLDIFMRKGFFAAFLLCCIIWMVWAIVLAFRED